MAASEDNSPEWVPFNDPFRFWRTAESGLPELLRSVILGGVAFAGPESERLRGRLCRELDRSYAVLCSSGTDALRLAMASLGVERGRIVATVANAGGYATIAALQLGADVRFVDVDWASLQMDPDSLESVLSTSHVSVVVVTHLYGNIANLREIQAICARYGVPIIEDCAQSMGAVVGQRPAGSFGDIATLSFYPTKNVGGLGDGGALATDDPILAQTATELSQYGWSDRYTVARRGGSNSRMDEIQAALINLSLSSLEEGMNLRTRIAERYESSLAGRAGIRLPTAEGRSSHLFPVVLDKPAEFHKKMADSRVQTGDHYPIPDHRQTAWEAQFGVQQLPVTEALAGRVATLPIFPMMTEAEISRVCDALQSA